MSQTVIVEPAKLRPATMLAKPVWIEPAFEDPDAVMALVRQSAPYPLSARVHKRDANGLDVPFFRIFWAHTREVKVKGAEPFFYNERFMQAARKSFGAEVIVPSGLMINLSAPALGGPPHRDLPYFRGAEKFPFWLLSCMGYSDLFHDWAVPIASTLSWFYNGVGGDFEYWPDGPDGASKLVRPPLWNVAVVSDNEYMWHRVGPVGPAGAQKKPGDISRECRMHAVGQDAWEMHDRDRVERLARDQVRVSVLWKAYAFSNQAAADEYQNHVNDLDYAVVTNIFATDLRRRGVPVAQLTGSVADPEWKALIQKTYTASFKGDSGSMAEY
jgi:hypothetical protein